MGKAEISRTIVRLFYLALADCPVNWLEPRLQYKFNDFDKLNCIDSIFEVLDKRRWEILRRANVSVYEYIKRKKFKTLPMIRGENFSQAHLSVLLNEIFGIIRRKFESGDKTAVEFLRYVKILENDKIPFEDFKQGNVYRVIIFKKDPEESRKGTNSLYALLMLWAIKNGDIHGANIEDLQRALEVFLCFSKNVINIDLNKAWELLNKTLETNYDYEFNCEKYGLL